MWKDPFVDEIHRIREEYGKISSKSITENSINLPHLAFVLIC